MASTTRRLIAVAPDVATSYGWLAQALYSVGQPIDAVRGALEQKWDRLPPGQRQKSQLADEASLATLTGHFEDADRFSRELEKEEAVAPMDAAHFFPAYERVLLALEVGRNSDALAIASDYMRRRSAWQPSDVTLEPTIYMFAAQVAAGGMTKAEFAEARTKWLAHDEARRGAPGLGRRGSGRRDGAPRMRSRRARTKKQRRPWSPVRVSAPSRRRPPPRRTNQWAARISSRVSSPTPSPSSRARPSRARCSTAWRLCSRPGQRSISEWRSRSAGTQPPRARPIVLSSNGGEPPPNRLREHSQGLRTRCRRSPARSDAQATSSSDD